MLVKCLYTYLWRHHCIHHLIYYSSIYRPFPSGIQHVVCHHYPLVSIWILDIQSSIQTILISNRITHHHIIMYAKVQHVSHFESNTNIYISIELHMTCSVIQLGCQQLSLVPPKYTAHPHYTSPSRCNNIHTIDELRTSLLLLCLYKYL